MSASFVLKDVLLDSVYVDRLVLRCGALSNYRELIIFEANNDSSLTAASSVSLKPSWVEITLRYKGSPPTNLDKRSLYDFHLKHLGVPEPCNASLYRIKSVVLSSNQILEEAEDIPTPDREELREMIEGYLRDTREAMDKFIARARASPASLVKCDTLIDLFEFLEKK